jgi:hypothetical protein
MALLFMDSFDHYATADLLTKYTAVGSLTTIAASEGRRGSGCLKSNLPASNSVNPMVTKYLLPNDATCIVGFAYQPPTILTDYPLFTVGDAADWHLGVYALGTAGILNVRRGSTFGGTVIGQASQPLSLTAFTYVEIRVTIHDTTGVVVMRYNNIEVLSLTNVDTKNLTLAGWTRVGFHTMFNGGATFARLDDLYILDGSGPAPWNGFLGDCRVDARVPTGAGAITQWTPLTGLNWENVDDVTPDGDATYNVAAAAGMTDTYAMQDAPVAGGQILGVQLLWNLKKMDAGPCAVTPVIRQGTTTLPGAAQNPGTGYSYQSQMYATNPHTSAAWLESDFNNAEFGLTRTD